MVLYPSSVKAILTICTNGEFYYELTDSPEEVIEILSSVKIDSVKRFEFFERIPSPSLILDRVNSVL